MNTEQQPEEKLNEELIFELVFTDKDRDCVECDKEKDIEISFGLSSREEWDSVMTLIKKYGLNRDELNYIYGFYNRELKENKSPGCGKCFYNICKNLEKRYTKLLNEQKI